MALANPIVARLAARSPGWAAPDYCGLLLITNWQAPEEVRLRYAEVRKALEAAIPSCGYLYPPSTLHCTIATLRAFTGGPLDGDIRVEEADRWRAVLDAARAMPDWPEGSFRLKLMAPVLEGACGIVKYTEIGGTKHIEQMRACVRKAIQAAGGLAAEGSGSRDKARALPGAPSKEPPPHIPDIVHSTVLRWASEPTESELAAAHAAFKMVAATWQPIEMTVDSGALAVFEDVPFMHIPYTPNQIFWRSRKPKAPKAPPAPAAWVALLAEVVVTMLLPFLLVIASVAFSGKKNYFYQPGKPQPTWPPHPPHIG